jgi:hypothetical protein
VSELNAGASEASRPIPIFILMLFAATAAALYGLGIGFDLAEISAVLAITAALMGGSAFYASVRRDPRLSRLFRGITEILLISFLCGTLSYAATSLNRPLWDATFHAWDQAIGFDWRHWLGVLDAHPRIHLVLAVAYHSFMPQVPLAIIALVTVRAYRELDAFILAYGLAAVATIAIAACMPALSPLVHLGITPADHPNIVLAVPREFEAQALALREGTMRMIDLDGAQGLVTFPSFHTVAAVLLAIAFWRVPVVRWAGLALNAAMLIAIPIEGSHYLVDVFAGAAVALAAYEAARRIVLWCERRLPDPHLVPAEELSRI